MPRGIPAPPPSQAPVPAGVELEYFDPAAVAIGSNYRAGGIELDPDELDPDELDRLLGVDDAFIESISAAGGNFEPVALLRRRKAPGRRKTIDGRAVVIKHGGARRLRGCARAGVELLGYVCGDEDDAKAEQLARLVAQWDENHQRKHTTAAADAKAIQGMLDLGMTEAAVRKATRVKGKDAIAHARKVNGSRIAGELSALYPLDLEQTAVIAEFDQAGDDEAVAALAAQIDADPAQFGHTAAQLRESAEDRAARRAAAAPLREDGVTVLGGWHWSKDLDSFRDEDGGPGRLTPEQHKDCPGHAAFLQANHLGSGTTYRPVYICTDPEKYGHRRHPALTGSTKQRRADMPEDERLAARFRDDWVKAGNREARAARAERLKWLRDFAARTKVPKEAAEFMAWYFTTSGYELRTSGERGHMLACEWLAIDVDAADKDYTAWGDRLEAIEAAYQAAAPGRRAVIGLACLLAAQEKNQGDGTAIWHDSDTEWPHRKMCARYLAFLESLGYTLSRIEEHTVRGTGRYTPVEMEGETPPGTEPPVQGCAPDPGETHNGVVEPDEPAITGPSDFTAVDIGAGIDDGGRERDSKDSASHQDRVEAGEVTGD